MSPSSVSALHCHLPPHGGRPRGGDSLQAASSVSALHCHLPPHGGRPRGGDSLPTACSLGQKPIAKSQKPIATYFIFAWYVSLIRQCFALPPSPTWRKASRGRLPSSFELQASSFKLPASSFQLRAYGFELRASGLKLPAKGGRPRGGDSLQAASEASVDFGGEVALIYHFIAVVD